MCVCVCVCVCVCCIGLPPMTTGMAADTCDTCCCCPSCIHEHLSCHQLAASFWFMLDSRAPAPLAPCGPPCAPQPPPHVSMLIKADRLHNSHSARSTLCWRRSKPSRGSPPHSLALPPAKVDFGLLLLCVCVCVVCAEDRETFQAVKV